MQYNDVYVPVDVSTWWRLDWETYRRGWKQNCLNWPVQQRAWIMTTFWCDYGIYKIFTNGQSTEFSRPENYYNDHKLSTMFWVIENLYIIRKISAGLSAEYRRFRGTVPNMEMNLSACLLCCLLPCFGLISGYQSVFEEVNCKIFM